jgi:hypothetical protein
MKTKQSGQVNLVMTVNLYLSLGTLPGLMIISPPFIIWEYQIRLIICFPGTEYTRIKKHLRKNSSQF